MSTTIAVRCLSSFFIRVLGQNPPRRGSLLDGIIYKLKVLTVVTIQILLWFLHLTAPRLIQDVMLAIGMILVQVVFQDTMHPQAALFANPVLLQTA